MDHPPAQPATPDSRTLVIYQTAACSLCEAALSLVLGIDALAGTTLDCIDIEADADLLARYGARIPVLRNPSTRCEIDWPFTGAEVLALGAGAPA